MSELIVLLGILFIAGSLGCEGPKQDAPLDNAAINAGRTESDYRLVNVLAGTMKAVYPHVFVINIPTAINSIVVGTTGPSDVAQFRANLATIRHPVLRQVADVAAVSVCEYVPPADPANPADPSSGGR